MSDKYTLYSLEAPLHHLVKYSWTLIFFIYNLGVVNTSHGKNGYGVTYMELDLLNG